MRQRELGRGRVVTSCGSPDWPSCGHLPQHRSRSAVDRHRGATQTSTPAWLAASLLPVVVALAHPQGMSRKSSQKPTQAKATSPVGRVIESATQLLRGARPKPPRQQEVPLPERKKERKLPRVIVYGFDAVGYDTPDVAEVLGNEVQIEFASLHEQIDTTRLEGLIFPQGAFERIELGGFGMYNRTSQVSVAEEALLETELLATNLLAEGKWVCSLISGVIIDQVPEQGVMLRSIKSTDLCKRLMNTYGVERRQIDPLPVEPCAAPEFSRYFKLAGMAKMMIVAGGAECQVIGRAVGYDLPAAVAIENKLFFLPLHMSGRDGALAGVCREVTSAIRAYRARMTEDPPEWAEEFRFLREAELDAEREALSRRAVELGAEHAQWRRYKTILTRTGSPLVAQVNKILREFFGLRVDDTDQGKEDSKIVDERGNALALLEIKGVKGGVKREHINQVDSHRERSGLSPEKPGLLVINTGLELTDIRRRLAATLAGEQVQYAKKSNVLIIRTIDLLHLMRQLEPISLADRAERFMEHARAGGGWLRADESRCIILDE